MKLCDTSFTMILKQINSQSISVSLEAKFWFKTTCLHFNDLDMKAHVRASSGSTHTVTAINMIHVLGIEQIIGHRFTKPGFSN